MVDELTFTNFCNLFNYYTDKIEEIAHYIISDQKLYYKQDALEIDWDFIEDSDYSIRVTWYVSGDYDGIKFPTSYLFGDNWKEAYHQDREEELRKEKEERELREKQKEEYNKKSQITQLRGLMKKYPEVVSDYIGDINELQRRERSGRNSRL